MSKTLCMAAAMLLWSAVLSAQPTPPSQLFDRQKMEYKGDKAAQARLLLRKVGLWGKITEQEARVDSAYLRLLNTAPGITKKQAKDYLLANHIPETEAGGAIDQPLSSIKVGSTTVYARYFVIHDVSTPAFQNTFPANINDASWSFNDPARWTKKVTHAYLTRTGKCNTVAGFSEGLRATKFELKILQTASRGLFLHVELIQPRIYPPGNATNAPKGPEPGFTDSQYQRLALLYVCASIRKGEWLVPAFHANIDQGLNDGHDDPQNFELNKFTNEILRLVTLLKNQ